MNKEIADWREKIDKIDDNILELLHKREIICEKIGKIKKENGWEIIDNKREKEIFENLRKKASELELEKDFIEDLFKKIIENSRKTQR